MSDINYNFVGWLAKSPDCIEKGTLVKEEFTPKPFAENDVDIKITHCGICGSDLHTLSAGWSKPDYPVCTGHEIVGMTVKVGPMVKHIKVGDRVGVGAQSDSCGECAECKTGKENYCANMTQTYNSRYKDGSKSYGGYANYARVPSHFVFKIPEGLSSEAAAPLLCAGKTVAIIGIGGLGHLGILFAKALGAERIVAISRTGSKKADAAKLGATDFIATSEDEKWSDKWNRTVDLIICTVSSASMPLARFLNLLKVDGTMVQVGAPEEPLPSLKPFAFLIKRIKLAGSMIASPSEIQEMLQLAAEKDVCTWVTTFPMDQVNDALKMFGKGEPRYRFVLVNQD
ncbi:alcohol dehydrogenase-like protein [Terfezia claveryi]|nr:alcohol dehydrogenase-like protein [Terfezia claveryi]